MSMTISASGASSMPQAMSGASMRMPPSQKMSSLFQKMDSANAGSINQQQFTQAFRTMNPPAGFKAMGPANVFGALNPNGTGNVSKQDFVSGMTDLMSKLRQNAAAVGGSGTATPAQSLSSSLQSLNALSGQSASASSGNGPLNTLV